MRYLVRIAILNSWHAPSSCCKAFHQPFLMFSKPFTVPGFCVGCDAFALGFSAFGLRISRFDFFWLFAMVWFSSN